MDQYDFKKNYIREVLFRVDFRNIPNLSNDDANPENFLKFIKEEFNIADENSDSKIWAFFNKDYSKRIEITPFSIVLSYDGEKYKSHKLIKKDIDYIIQILKFYSISTVNKMGLRYINEITPHNNIECWEDWINPVLLNFNTIDDNLQLIRSLTQSESKIDEFILNFIYGQFNLNYPDVNIKNNFVLDYDCHTFSLTDVDSLLIKFDQMHDIIRNLFIKSIGECLIKDLSGEL